MPQPSMLYADVLRKAFNDHGLQPYGATNRDRRYKVLRVKGMFTTVTLYTWDLSCLFCRFDRYAVF